jgi:hypothetical protein
LENSVNSLTSGDGPPPKIALVVLQVGQKLYGPKHNAYGFRTPGLIRFVNEEEAYLSPTNGGPRMYINLEDHLSYNTGKPNKEFLVRNPNDTQPAFSSVHAAISRGGPQRVLGFKCIVTIQHSKHDWASLDFFSGGILLRQTDAPDVSQSATWNHVSLLVRGVEQILNLICRDLTKHSWCQVGDLAQVVFQFMC